MQGMEGVKPDELKKYSGDTDLHLLQQSHPLQPFQASPPVLVNAFYKSNKGLVP